MLLKEARQLTNGEIVRDYEGNEYEVECVRGTGDDEYLSVWLKMTKFVREVHVPSVQSDPVYFKRVGESYVIGAKEQAHPEWLSIEDVETLENQRVPHFTVGEIVKDHLGNEYEVRRTDYRQPVLLELKMTKFKEPIMVPSTEDDPIYLDHVGAEYSIGTRNFRQRGWLVIEDLTPLTGNPRDITEPQVSTTGEIDSEIDGDFPDAQYFTDGEIVKDQHGNYYEVTKYDAPYWIRLRMRFTNKVVFASGYNAFDCIGREYWIGMPESLVAQGAKDRHPDAYVTLEDITKVKFGVARPRSGDLLLDSRGNLTKVIYERGDCTLRVDTVHISKTWGPIEMDTESFTIDLYSDYFKDCIKVDTESDTSVKGETPGYFTFGEISREGKEIEFTAESCAKRAEVKALNDIEVLIKQAVQEGKFQVVRNDAPRLKSLLEAKGFEVVGNTIRW